MQPADNWPIKLNPPANHHKILRLYQFMKVCWLIVYSLVTMISIAFGQTVTRGVVVDSASMAALQGVHIRIKNSSRQTITDDRGFFSILTRRTDTLVCTMTGYQLLQIPLYFEEPGILVRMSEDVKWLDEITISATRLGPAEINRATRRRPTPMPEVEAFSSPFDYFSKWQREKRKLLATIEEHERTLTYVEVVTDPVIRESLMVEFRLNEETYFDLLVKFNQQNSDVLYSTNPEQIIAHLKFFLAKTAR
jgi:hypothetical protein